MAGSMSDRNTLRGRPLHFSGHVAWIDFSLRATYVGTCPRSGYLHNTHRTQSFLRFLRRNTKSTRMVNIWNSELADQSPWIESKSVLSRFRSQYSQNLCNSVLLIGRFVNVYRSKPFWGKGKCSISGVNDDTIVSRNLWFNYIDRVSVRWIWWWACHWLRSYWFDRGTME
jgi:hypothetical protein